MLAVVKYNILKKKIPKISLIWNMYAQDRWLNIKVILILVQFHFNR